MRHKPDHFQQQAIDSTARGIRIVAPAGSGKSETLARRIAKRIERDGIDPGRILVLTYDNAAKKSLTGFFGDFLDRRQMPQIRTLNGHGNQILRAHFPQERADLPNTGTSEVSELKRSFNRQSYDLPVLSWDGVNRKLVEDVFTALKNQGFYPGRGGERERQTKWLRDEYLRIPREGESSTLEEFLGMPDAPAQEENYSGQLSTILDLFAEFDVEMRKIGQMDYVDQKARAVEQLRITRSAREQIQAEFDEIVVDECQDINRLDAMLVYYTASPETLVVLAGDDDQTLYEFRNAHSLYLRKPEMVFQNIEFETIHLNLNYRSPQAILEPAVKLIAHNVERIEKSPASGVTDPGEVQVLPLGSERQLKERLLTDIRQEIANGRSPADIAILCHPVLDRSMTSQMERMLRDTRIPVAVEASGQRQETPGVSVVSFLKAKGRQWPVVFIPGVNDREVPDSGSIRKGEVEAVRRRFYVAMTRAREKLVFSYVRGGEQDRIDYTAEGDVLGTNGASRFLFEAGLVEGSAPQAPSEPVAAPETANETTAASPAEQAPKVVETAQPSVQEKSTPQPVQSAAKPEPEAPKKRVRPKPWEPRADDTRRMKKAHSEWENGDHDNAIFCAWKPLESALKRLVKFPPGATNTEMLHVIDEALVQNIIDFQWKDRLHLWRRVRNQAFHDDNPKRRSFTDAQMQDYGYQLVDMASEFFVHLADMNAPKQMALETQDEFLMKLGGLVMTIQQGRPHRKSGKPLKAIRFNPAQDQFDILAMQMMMVMRYVRFYIPSEFRWSTSPIVNKFCVAVIGHIPQGFRTESNNRMRLQPGEQLNQLIARFERMLVQEAGETELRAFLLERVEAALALENGNFHAGLKLNPRTPV